MAIYEYSCKECQLIWECDFPFAKMEKKTPCPECEAECSQHWAGRNVPIHFKGAGWSGVNKNTGFNKTGGSDVVNLELQRGCEERMKTGWQHYGKYEMTPAYVEEVGARKLSENEVKDKLEASRKLTAHTYDKAGMNPYEKTKPQ